MANKIYRIEWEAYEKGCRKTKGGYFIKVSNRYFQIFYDESHMELDDNKITSKEEVEMNILGEFRGLKHYV